MQSFLCRVMALVFIFNCLSPAPGVWAQTSANDLATRLQAGVEKSVSEQLEDSLMAAMLEFQYAETPTELAKAIDKLHKVSEQKAAAKKQEEERQKRLNASYVMPRSSTYVATPNPQIFRTPQKNEVLEKLAQNKLDLDSMIEYIDPFDPAQYNIQNIVYASEILGNSIDATLAYPIDEALLWEMNAFVLHAQMRVLYRLTQLTKKPYSSIYDVMAAGSLRITLWKLHNYYVQTYQEDPLTMPQQSDILNQQKPIVTTPSWMKDGPVFFNITAPLASRETAYIVPPNIYQQMNEKFLSELSALKAQNPKEGSHEQQMLLALADYAAAYAMIQSPASITPIVKLFDDGAKVTSRGNVVSGKFNRQYSSVLNTVFTTVFESAKYLSPDSSVWNETISMLKDFSDPKKYSLPTRIFALEAASLMYQTNQSCQTPNNANMPAYPVYLRCNTGDTSDAETRALFAARTVDIYEPLQQTHYLALDDYGLDSQQMQMLSDKLAFIYNGFANDELKMDSSRKRMPNSYVLDKDTEGKSLILNDSTSIPRLVPINQGQLFTLPNGQLKTISGFGRASDGHWVEMNLRNGLNSKKESDEMTIAFAAFVGNAVFWIYGGEIFSFIGMAYRATKGAMIALPKAIKAAATANKGRRGLAFGIEIQKSVRFANLQKNLAKNGVRLVRQSYVEKTVKGKAKKMPATSSYSPEIKTITKDIKSQHALKGKYSKWNPKRWVGIKPPEMNRIYFTQNLPGFNIIAGSADVTGTPLSKGLRSWDDWRKLRGSFISSDAPAPNYASEALSTFTKGFRSSTDPKIHVFPQFFDYKTRMNIFQEMRLNEAFTKAARRGAFDAWVEVKTPVYQASSGKMVGESTSWWNVARNGAPGNEIVEGGLNNILITPRVSGRLLKTNAVDPTKLNGVSVPVTNILQDTWQPFLIRHYFKEVNRTGIGKYVLPKYVPNANFWNTAKSNWRFGLPLGRKLVSNTRFWKGFQGNMIFFGAWAGLDMATYPAMNAWITSAAEDDQTEALKAFGDSFDPKKLEEDAQALEKQKQEAGITDSPADQMHLDTYSQVTGAAKPSSEGALLTFPILAFRYYLPDWTTNLGLKLNFVTDQNKDMWSQMSTRIQLNRAVREQRETIQEEQAKQLAEWRENSAQQVREQLAQTRAMDEETFFNLGGESAKKEVGAIYQQYTDKMLNVFKTDESPESQIGKIEELKQELDNKLLTLYQELYRRQELLVPQEEYIPDYGEYFEEEPVEGY